MTYSPESTTCDFPEALSPRRRGRRPVAADPKQRARHIAVAFDLLMRGDRPIKQVARDHKISIRSVFNYRDLALGYDDAEAEGLRRLAGFGL